MAVIPSVSSDVLTAQERWRRWEQRGLDSDACFMRRLRRAFWFAVIATIGVLMFSLY